MPSEETLIKVLIWPVRIFKRWKYTVGVDHNVNQSQEDSKSNKNPDLTGRDRLVLNVVFSWAAHSVFIVAGFIMPRMIDRKLGQELLGIWDFSWSLVSYFNLVQAGIASSVNRYVGRYRAMGDLSGVNRIVSSASCILLGSGLLVLCMTTCLSLLLPELFEARLGENVHEAQWVVFFLGASLAVQMIFSPYGGVITGCHRWDFQNAINGGSHAVIVGGMITALLTGGGLPKLALINLLGMLLAGTMRIIVAHRVCRDLHVRFSLVRRSTIRNVFVFGGKTLIPSVSNLLLNQTTNILIMVYIGPAALALYARPRSLMFHVDSLVRKMAMILVPTASSLQGTSDFKDIRDLLIKAVCYSCYMVLPIVLVMIVFGDSILQLWMGPHYANSIIPAILSAGFLATLVQIPALMILVGLNAHGRAGLGQFVASVCSVGLTILALGYFKWGIIGAAISVAIPLTIVNIIYLPLLTCRRVNLHIKQYFFSIAAGPLIHVLPFLFCLVLARFVFSSKPLIGLALGGTVGSLILAIIYWRCVLPHRIKKWVSFYIFRLVRWSGLMNRTETVA